MGPLGMEGEDQTVGPQPHCRVHLPQGLQTGRSLLLLRRSGGATQDSDGGGDSTLWLGTKDGDGVKTEVAVGQAGVRTWTDMEEDW